MFFGESGSWTSDSSWTVGPSEFRQTPIKRPTDGLSPTHINEKTFFKKFDKKKRLGEGILNPLVPLSKVVAAKIYTKENKASENFRRSIQ